MSLFDKLELSREELEAQEAEVNKTESTEVDETPEDEEETVTVVEENGATNEEVANQSELETELLEVQEENEELSEVEQDTETAVEALNAAALSIENLVYAQATQSFTVAHAEAHQLHLTTLGLQVGIPSHQTKVIDVSTESYSTAGATEVSLEGALSATKDFFIKILDSIIKAIAWILEKGQQLFVKMFGSLSKMEKALKAIDERVNKLTENNAVAKYKEFKSATAVRSLTIDRQVKSLTEVVSVLHSVTNSVAGYNAAGVAKTAIDIVKDAEGVVGKMAKASVVVSEVTESTVGVEDSIIKLIDNNVGGQSKFKDVTNNSAKYGIKDIVNGKLYASETLPKDKAIIMAIGFKKSDKENVSFGRSFVKLVSVGKENTDKADISLKVESLPTIKAGVNTLLQCVKKLKEVEKKQKAAEPAIKALKSAIWSLRKGYLAVTQAQRQNRGFVENNREIRAQISIVKDTIGMIREPASSFIAYFLFEAQGLLGYINQNLKAYSNDAMFTKKVSS